MHIVNIQNNLNHHFKLELLVKFLLNSNKIQKGYKHT